MKKGFIKLLILLLLLIPITPIVNAKEKIEKEEKEKTEEKNYIDLKKDEIDDDWSYVLDTDQFKMTITGYFLNVYELNADSPKITETEESEGSTTSITITEDEKKYRDEEPVAVYSIDLSRISMTPSKKVDKVSNIDTVLFDTDARISEAALREILEEELADVTEKKKYIVDLCAKFTLDELKGELAHAYKYDYIRILEGSTLNNAGLPELEVGKQDYQVINRIGIELGEDARPVLSYVTTIEARNAISFMNFIGFSSQPITKSSDSPEYFLLMHNVENIDILSDSYEGDNPSTATTDTPQPEPQKVAIGDTGLMVSSLTYVKGFVFIVTGLAIIGMTLKRKQKRS